MPSSIHALAQNKNPGGRRKGASSTREAILQAAVGLFAERGYDGTTLRSVTDRAGVDVAMVSHFFGGKRGLFDEAVLKRGQRTVATLFDSDLGGRPAAQLLDAYFSMWDEPETAQAVRAIFRASLESDEYRDQLQMLMNERLDGAIQLLFRPGGDATSAESVGHTFSPDELALRTQLIAAHLIGTGIARYIVRLSPLAETPRETLIEMLSPVIEKHLGLG